MSDTTSHPARRPSRPEFEPAVTALLHELYERAAEDCAARELRSLACRGIASIFDLPLVLMLRKCKSGIAAAEANSAENLLWAELQRLPERWDGTAVGEGAAARALRDGRPAALRVNEEGFLAWRRTAEREGIKASAAWPFLLPDGPWAFELFDTEPARLQTAGFSARIAAAVNGLQRFFQNLPKLESRRLLASALECAGNAAFITDLDGTIVWANSAFSRLSGHAEADIVGRNPRVLQSGKQAIRYYRDLWSTIRSGKVWTGETVDRDAKGHTYAILQTVSPVALNERVTHYLSVQNDISKQRARAIRQDIRIARDDTTGLLTRAAFELAFVQAIAHKPKRLTLVAISTRNFQQAVARFGADTVEEVAAEMGDRIGTVVEAPALVSAAAAVAAPGEFLVMLEGDAASPEQCSRVLRELRRELEQPYSLPPDQPPMDFRAALAHYPADGLTFDALVRSADLLLSDEPMQPARRRLAKG